MVWGRNLPPPSPQINPTQFRDPISLASQGKYIGMKNRIAAQKITTATWTKRPLASLKTTSPAPAKQSTSSANLTARLSEIRKQDNARHIPKTTASMIFNKTMVTPSKGTRCPEQRQRTNSRDQVWPCAFSNPDHSAFAAPLTPMPAAPTRYG